MADSFSWLPSGNDPQDAREVFEENEKMNAAAQQLARERARLFFDVFATGRGPELLELLREQTLELDLMSVSPVIGNHLREMGVEPSQWAYHRNGQNSVVRYFYDQLRLAQLLETEGNENG